MSGVNVWTTVTLMNQLLIAQREQRYTGVRLIQRMHTLPGRALIIARIRLWHARDWSKYKE